MFFVIVVGLAAGFALLNREPTTPVVKWKTGETVDVEITLVKSDQKDLACASAEEIAGMHCAFETTTKPWSKGSVGDDKKLLKPYTTIDRISSPRRACGRSRRSRPTSSLRLASA